MALVNMDLLSVEQKVSCSGFMSGAADLDDPRLFKVLRPSLQSAAVQDGY